MKHLKKFESNSHGLTDKEKDIICSAIDSEGFAYAFADYSNFDEVKDEEFHRLRREFIDAYNKLNDYVGFEDWQD